MNVRLAMPIFAALLITGLLSLFFCCDPRLGVGPRAWLASVLVTSLVTMCCGFWLASREQGISGARIFIGSFLPMAAITIIIAPINAWLRFSDGDHLSAWCLVLLFLIALAVAPFSWRIARQV